MRRGRRIAEAGLSAGLRGGIAIYRWTVSPLLWFVGVRCRFEPSCSAYGMEALRKYGPWKGTWMTIRRIGRCHPWHPGGYDPP